MSASPRTALSPAPAGPWYKEPWVPYVVPFAAFMLLLSIGGTLERIFGIWEYPLRVAVLTAVLVGVSHSVIQLRPVMPFGTILVGAGVFALWVGPDLLFPHYRDHWLFQNSLFGKQSSITPAFLDNPMVLFFRCVRAVLIVPILEELFWRGWLMRWLIDPQFIKVPLGTYQRGAFAITAVLFALEHGTYWDVGLLAGVAYNGWMVRTKSLADCIWAHAITNGLLCAYVLLTHQWVYWQ